MATFFRRERSGALQINSSLCVSWTVWSTLDSKAFGFECALLDVGPSVTESGGRLANCNAVELFLLVFWDSTFVTASLCGSVLGFVPVFLFCFWDADVLEVQVGGKAEVVVEES